MDRKAMAFRVRKYELHAAVAVSPKVFLQGIGQLVAVHD